MTHDREGVKSEHTYSYLHSMPNFEISRNFIFCSSKDFWKIWDNDSISPEDFAKFWEKSSKSTRKRTNLGVNLSHWNLRSGGEGLDFMSKHEQVHLSVAWADNGYDLQEIDESWMRWIKLHQSFHLWSKSSNTWTSGVLKSLHSPVLKCMQLLSWRRWKCGSKNV